MRCLSPTAGRVSDKLTRCKDECLSATKAPEPFSVLLRHFCGYFSQAFFGSGSANACKDECSSAMKSAKSRRFGPPKKHAPQKGWHYPKTSASADWFLRTASATMQSRQTGAVSG